MFKHNPLPFHDRAMPAANASMCANEQGKFWPMHDAIFENNRELEDKNLETYATTAGLDMAKFKSCYAENKHQKQIQEDQQTATKLGARGTPAFFINGRYLSGARPFDQFVPLIDEELTKAKASGIAKAEYYKKAVVAGGKQAM